MCLGNLVYKITPEAPGFKILPALMPGQIPSTVPAAEKFIVIDAGHGGDDPGTQGNGLYEKNGTLPIAISLGKALEAKGLKVLLTRSEDTTIALESRSVISNSAPRRCFVSVHLNHSDSPKSSGIETYYGWPKRLEVARALQAELNLKPQETVIDHRSRLLAEAVHRSAIRATQANDREVRNNPNLLVLNAIAAPSILIECGFVSNKAEKNRLCDPDYQDKLAKGIADGIEEFLHAVDENERYGLDISEVSGDKK